MPFLAKAFALLLLLPAMGSGLKCKRSGGYQGKPKTAKETLKHVKKVDFPESIESEEVDCSRIRGKKWNICVIAANFDSSEWVLDCAYKEPGGRTRGCLTYHRGQDSGTVFSDGGKRKFHVCMCDSDNCNGEGRYMDYVKKLVAGNVVPIDAEKKH